MPRIKAMMQPIKTDDSDSTRCCHNAVSISGRCLGVQIKGAAILCLSQYTFLLEELGGDVLRLLLITLDGGIHGAHVLGGQQPADPVQHLGDLRISRQGVLANHRYKKVRWEGVLVIVQYHESVLRDLPVCGKAKGDVDVPRGQRTIADAEFGKIAKFLEANSINPVHTRQTITSIRETPFGPKA